MMGKKIDVDGWTINDVLELYANNGLFVDQKYQRKLVWSLKDKQLFIDSLVNHYPIPNIMMSESMDEDNNTVYGIIDGLQRINAIISFMLEEFPVEINGKQGYFDVSATPSTFDMSQNGELKQKLPVLDKNICIEFRGYKLPIISTSHDTKTIDEIFKRLNSTGTKLSRHDLRQAGATNLYSKLVREISSIIRGGKTAFDIVPLKMMPEISLSSTGLEYGIDINKVFWRKHGILTEDALRKSRDEEIVAILIAAFLLDSPMVLIKSDNLDDLYGEESEVSRNINDKLEKCYENIKTLFVQIFNEIEMIFDDTNYTISDMLFATDKNKTDIFMAFFQSMLQSYFDGKAIADNREFADALYNIKNQILDKINEKNTQEYIREKNTIKLISDVSSSYMVNTESLSPLVNEVITRLNLSSVETRFTEYKIGFTYFNCDNKYKYNEGKLNYKNVSQIAKVASAMANTNKNDSYKSMIIVGVADKESDYEVWSSFFGINAYKYNNHRVVGIDAEAKRNYKNIDNLMLKFIEKINEEPISEELKENLTNYDVITIQKRSLVVFTITVAAPQLYDGKKYKRKGTSLVECVN